ncbi:tetratricopeptide repeat protein [Trichothermofontia sp.]
MKRLLVKRLLGQGYGPSATRYRQTHAGTVEVHLGPVLRGLTWLWVPIAVLWVTALPVAANPLLDSLHERSADGTDRVRVEGTYPDAAPLEPLPVPIQPPHQRAIDERQLSDLVDNRIAASHFLRDRIQAEVDRAFSHTLPVQTALLVLLALAPSAAAWGAWKLLRQLGEKTTHAQQAIASLSQDAIATLKWAIADGQGVLNDLSKQTQIAEFKVEQLRSRAEGQLQKLVEEIRRENQQIRQDLAKVLPTLMADPSLSPTQPPEIQVQTQETLAAIAASPGAASFVAAATTDSREATDETFTEGVQARSLYLMDQGNTHFQAGRYAEALACYDEIIELQPDQAEAWHNRGTSLAKLKRFDEAIAAYQRATTLAPDYAEAWFNWGSILLSQKQPEAALRCYDQAIKYRPNYAEVWHNRGNALVQLQRYDAAIAAYERATEINPNYGDAWQNRGSVLAKVRRYPEALGCLDRAVDLKPQDVDLRFNQANLLVQLEQYEAALAAYTEVVERQPRHTAAWLNRGHVLMQLRRYQSALTCYEQACQLNPDDPDPWYRQGHALFELGRYEEALVAYDWAIQRQPDYPEAWNNRGNVLERLNRYEEAIAAYDHAIQLNANYYYAWDNRGYTLAKIGSHQEAIASLDRALDLRPDYANGYYNRAYCYAVQGDMAAAIANLQRAIQLNPFYQSLVKADPDFAAVRATTEFQALLQPNLNREPQHV